MSVYVSTWVWEQELPPTEKIILLKLADNAHDDGTHVFPSVATIARMTGVSERQVQRYLKAFVERGDLTIVANEQGGRGRTREYEFTRYINRQKGDTGTSQRVTPTTLKGDTENIKGDIHDTKGDTAMSPEPSIEPSDIEPSGNRQRTSTDEDFESWWSVYPRKVKKADARKAFQKINPDPVILARMIADVQARIRSKDWTEQDGKFIPHPTSYLNQRRWEDEDGTMPAPTPLLDRELTQEELREFKRWDDGWQAVYGADSDGFLKWSRDLAAGTLRQRGRRQS